VDIGAPVRTLFVGSSVEYWSNLTAEFSKGKGGEGAALFTETVLHSLAQTCGIACIPHSAITASNPLGEATPFVGGYGELKIGCTVNGTVPLVYKEFNSKHYQRTSKRFQECAREMYMLNLATRAAPAYVVPPHNYGVVNLEQRRKAPFLLFMDHGISLHDFLRKPAIPMDLECKRQIGLRMVRGLTELHACGIAHGDLRAANLVLSPIRPASLCFIDFGLARLEPRAATAVDGFSRARWSAGRKHQERGSVYAPEYGEGGPTAATDMWAVAALLVRLFTRSAKDALLAVPDTETAKRVPAILTKRWPNPEVGRKLWGLILDCGKIAAADRPSAAALAAAFEASRVDPTSGKLVPYEPPAAEQLKHKFNRRRSF